MTKIAEMLKNAHNHKKSSSPESTRPIALKLGIVALGSVVLQSLYKS